MEMICDILMADKPIGTARIKKEGLYYNIHCTCKLSGAVICRLVACCGSKQQDLGICVPMNGQFGVQTKIPVKRLGEGAMVIRVEPNHGDVSKRFVPIRAEEPFAYIDKLQNAYFAFRNKQPGVILPEEDQSVSEM